MIHLLTLVLLILCFWVLPAPTTTSTTPLIYCVVIDVMPHEPAVHIACEAQDILIRRFDRYEWTRENFMKLKGLGEVEPRDGQVLLKERSGEFVSVVGGEPLPREIRRLVEFAVADKS